MMLRTVGTVQPSRRAMAAGGVPLARASRIWQRWPVKVFGSASPAAGAVGGPRSERKQRGEVSYLIIYAQLQLEKASFDNALGHHRAGQGYCQELWIRISSGGVPLVDPL